MLKTFSFIFIIVFSINSLTKSYAQENSQEEKEKIPFKERIFYGGGLGLAFGTITNVNVSPTVGYKLTEKVVMGFGVSYQYYNDKRYNPPYTYNIYGGNVFSRYYFMKQAFVHGEYEYLSYKTNFFSALGFMERIESHNYLVGGGYRTQLAKKVWANLIVLYNLNETPYTPYSNPVFRITIDAGL